MNKGIAWVCVAAALLPASAARATLIEVDFDMFNLFSQGKVVAKRGVSILGTVGAEQKILLGKESQIDGDVYTFDRFKVRQNSIIKGRVISSGDLVVGRNVEIGALDSGDDLRIARDTLVLGHVAFAGDFRIHDTVEIGEGILTLLDAWHAEAPPLASITAPGSQGVLVAKNKVIDLPPGDYADLTVGRNATVILRAGTYTFDNVRLAKKVKVIGDTEDGPIGVNLAGKLRIRRKSSLGTEGSLGITVSAGGKIRIGRETRVTANMVSRDRLIVGPKGLLDGSYRAAGNVKLGKKVVVVPEPYSIVLLSAALPYLWRRRGNILRDRDDPEKGIHAL